ncbi:MAG TPA: hypothetical protein VK912_04970 [Longimicrobiales bacterium]|nr:hypothetical protein [Longimicrobiales bacterium]
MALTDSSAASTSRPERTEGSPVSSRVGRVLLPVGLLTAWSYAACVFLYKETVFGVHIGAVLFVVLFGAVALLLIALPSQLIIRRRVTPAAAVNAAVALLSTVFMLVTADTVYAIYGNAARLRALDTVSEAVRRRDLHVWHGELFPRMYRPTGRNFVLYKPNVRISGNTFGEFYNSNMAASTTLVDSVLELRALSYAIGPHGLRELESLAAAEIFALGDSFVFGYATDEGKVWTDLLGASLGRPVYNMGVSSTGPRSQLMLLEHFLTTQPDSMHVRHVLWMIFEGNDLENDYAETFADATTGAGGSLLDGTVAQAMVGVPGRVKQQSILGQAARGELVGVRKDATETAGTWQVDGVRLSFPLYHSSRWGYRLFSPRDVERATMPLEYVLEHPNRPLLDRTFQDMRALADRHGFSVTVMVAPSAARLHGAEFDDFPALSPQPHFIDYVLSQAEKSGFDTLDLYRELMPFAESELLYYRDDHHWNEHGNEIVAQLIESALARH